MIRLKKINTPFKMIKQMLRSLLIELIYYGAPVMSLTLTPYLEHGGDNY